MYWMEFIIKLNEEQEGGNLILFDDCGNDIKELKNTFTNKDEIICFAKKMPKTIIETYEGELITVEEYENKGKIL